MYSDPCFLLERLTPSPFKTFTAFVGCEVAEDAKALLDASAPCIGFAEDINRQDLLSALQLRYAASACFGRGSKAVAHRP